MIQLSIKDSIKILIAARHTKDPLLNRVYNEAIEPCLKNRNVDIERMISEVLVKDAKKEYRKEREEFYNETSQANIS